MNRTKNRDGFTVIEVIIAIVVLSIGLLGLTATAASVTRMVAQGQRYNRASALANERFEKVRALRCTSMTGGSATQGAYSIAWTVTSVSGGGAETSRVDQLSRPPGAARGPTISPRRCHAEPQTRVLLDRIDGCPGVAVIGGNHDLQGVGEQSAGLPPAGRAGGPESEPAHRCRGAAFGAPRSWMRVTYPAATSWP